MDGIPLGPIESAALLAIAWLAIAGGRLPGAAVVATLLVVTYLAGAAIPGEGGLRARYFANGAGSGAHERSIEYPDDAFTRIDRRLQFDSSAQLPLPFFNDNSRFNFYKPGEPNRRLMEFAVRWSGLWWVDRERPTVFLDAPGSTSEVFVDGQSMVALSPSGGSPIVVELALAEGWHRLDLMFSSPYGGPRIFSAGTIENGRRVPFDAASVVTQQIRGWQMSGARLLRRVRFAADVALLVCLAWLVASRLVGLARQWPRPVLPSVRLRHVMWMLAAVAAVDALAVAWPWWQQNMVLVGGDDTMTYEGYARDIVLNGLLMNGGRPAGSGEPFYYQAFYPYFLAATHVLFGEGMFGPVLVQRLLAAFAVWTLVEIAVEFTTERVWAVALPLAAAFMWWKFRYIALQPLNESLYVPLLAATAASLVRLCRAPSLRAAFTSGVLSGVTTITRSTALLAWIVVWPLCWLATKGAPRRGSIITMLVASTMAIFSLIAIRNWIVARVFAPTSTELGITLLGGNEVPPDLQIDLAARSRIYQRFRISEPTATVIEYAINAPGRFAQNIGRKALFALGFYEPYAPGWGYSPVYIAVWTTAGVGLILVLRSGRPAIVVLLPALMALTQFIAVVIVYPKGERLIVPIHTLLIPYSAVTAWHAIQTAAARMRQRSA